MPDKIEELLRSIHIMLAKSEVYNDSPDMVIISKREMFDILEKLNETLYEVLDQYEATTRSKERARLEMDKQAAEIIAEARHSAEEVHAASLMYTDTMLEELKIIIDKTSKNIRHEYIEMLAAMDTRIEGLDENRRELTDQLGELHESERYVKMLKELREKSNKKNIAREPEEDVEEFEEEPQKKADIIIKVAKPGTNPGVTIASRNRKSKADKKKQIEDIKHGEPETAVTEEPDAAGLPYGTTFQAEDFNLDAEYDDWKKNQEQETSGENEGKSGKESKKGLWGIFGKK